MTDLSDDTTARILKVALGPVLRPSRTEAATPSRGAVSETTRQRAVMDHGLPLVPVVAGVLLAYAAYLAYTVVHYIHRPAADKTSRL